MRVSGFWLTLLLVIGMVASLVGMAGWIIGFFYADPAQAAAHPVMYPLAKIAVIIGPIMVFGGAALFIFSIYSISRHEKTSPPPLEVPVEQPKIRPVRKHRPRVEEGEEDEEELLKKYIEP